MVSFASGDVTRLIEKIENEPMLEVKVTRKRPTSAGAPRRKVPVTDAETAASRNRSTMKKNEEIIAQHIAKLETEMHSRFRLTEEKLLTKVSTLEKRVAELETKNAHAESVNVELLKRIHNTHKTDNERLTTMIEKVQEAVKAAESHSENTGKSLKAASDKMGSHRKDFTHLLYRVDILERKVDDTAEVVKEKAPMESPPAKEKYRGSPSKGSSPPNPYKTSRPHRNGSVPLEHDIASLKYDYMCMKKKVEKLATKRTLATPGTYTEPAGGLDDFREQFEELQGDMRALHKHTQKTLKTQDAAILCLYNNSDFKAKMGITPVEMIDIFGRLDGGLDAEGEIESILKETRRTIESPSPTKPWR